MRHAALPLLLLSAAATGAGQPIRPGHPEWPAAWITYFQVESRDKDFADLKAHGVGLVSMETRDEAAARQALADARRHRMKYHIALPDITKSAALVREMGQKPADALMIGGVYRGKAIDRHVFAFKAGPQRIVIEPPVYAAGYQYRAGGGGTVKGGEPMGHYFPDIPDPVLAEIVVPLRRFDGKQHLKILPAAIRVAAKDARLEADSVTPGMPETSESRNRKLYELSFDLTGFSGALLDQVGVAVYWPYRGTRKYGLLQGGVVSAAAPSTREALRRVVRQRLARWSAANGGKFPLDVVIAARFGDEMFYPTGHQGSRSTAVNYPLWEFSAPSIAAFRAMAGNAEHPRTWGFPEIYGADAYACWLYNLHAKTAALAGVVRDEVAKVAPGLMVFRNTTRVGIFAPANDHDGSGPELLTRNLDLVHLDPYPIGESDYKPAIPRDMSYYAGLARRYGRPLAPWMQSFVNTMTVGTRHPTPELLDRMAEEQWRQGVDAIVWLGYGTGRYSFPRGAPQTWDRAAVFHKRLAASPPAKPKPEVAVLRPYTTWALGSLWEGKVRNPSDWLLQQWLEVWSVTHGRPYDVFEAPPRMSREEAAAMERQLAGYARVVTTLPREAAWVVAASATSIDIGQAKEVQSKFEAEMRSRGWLAPK